MVKSCVCGYRWSRRIAPAVSLPLAWSAEGLPIGVQFVADLAVAPLEFLGRDVPLVDDAAHAVDRLPLRELGEVDLERVPVNHANVAPVLETTSQIRGQPVVLLDQHQASDAA